MLKLNEAKDALARTALKVILDWWVAKCKGLCQNPTARCWRTKQWEWKMGSQGCIEIALNMLWDSRSTENGDLHCQNPSTNSDRNNNKCTVNQKKRLHGDENLGSLLSGNDFRRRRHFTTMPINYDRSGAYKRYVHTTCCNAALWSTVMGYYLASMVSSDCNLGERTRKLPRNLSVCAGLSLPVDPHHRKLSAFARVQVAANIILWPLR